MVHEAMSSMSSHMMIDILSDSRTEFGSRANSDWSVLRLAFRRNDFETVSKRFKAVSWIADWKETLSSLKNNDLSAEGYYSHFKILSEIDFLN